MEWLGLVPKFKTGDTVYVASHSNEITQTKVRSVPVDFMVLDDGVEYIVFRKKYTLNLMHYPSGGWDWPEIYVHSSLEEAERQHKFLSVSLTEDQWFQCIGDRDIEDGLENCELGPCCAVISDIRDILFEVKKKGGITEVDRQELKMMFEQHEPCDATSNSESILFNLLSQLDLKWELPDKS